MTIKNSTNLYYENLIPRESEPMDSTTDVLRMKRGAQLTADNLWLRGGKATWSGACYAHDHGRLRYRVSGFKRHLNANTFLAL